jgi:hypothetical protein
MEWRGPSYPGSAVFASVDSVAKIGNWTNADKVEVCALKLTDGAHVYWATPELRDPAISWQF